MTDAERESESRSNSSLRPLSVIYWSSKPGLYFPLCTVTVEEIDKYIFDLQDTLSSLPRSSHHRAVLLSNLARLRLNRFLQLDGEQDLEMSILHFTHAIFIPSPSSTEDGPDLLSILLSLSRALIHRSRKYNRLNDVGYSIKCLHFLRELSPTTSGVTRTNV